MESSPTRPLKLEGFFIPYQETYKCYDHVLLLLILDFFGRNTLCQILLEAMKKRALILH
jgi:hypothetical protein